MWKVLIIVGYNKIELCLPGKYLENTKQERCL